MVEIREVRDLELLPVAGFAAAAEAEGFRFVDRLLKDYRACLNRFDKPGEALFGAVSDDLLGICGLNIDPHEATPRIGRVRHLYVLPKLRRQGIGRRLVERVIAQATPHFDVLTLRTDNPRAALFYEVLGFSPVTEQTHATHRLVLTV